MPVYNYPDQTRFGRGDQALVCTGNGNYAGGGGNDEATRAAIQSSIERNKQRISEEESKFNACKGKQKDFARLKSEAGCDESRVRELERQNADLYARGERNAAIDNEISAITAKCKIAENEYSYGECQEKRQSDRRSGIDRFRAALALDESNLARLNACIADKKRREEAARRPQIDPAAAIIIMQGLQGSGRRPPSSGQSQPPTRPP